MLKKFVLVLSIFIVSTSIYSQNNNSHSRDNVAVVSFVGIDEDTFNNVDENLNEIFLSKDGFNTDPSKLFKIEMDAIFPKDFTKVFLKAVNSIKDKKDPTMVFAFASHGNEEVIGREDGSSIEYKVLFDTFFEDVIKDNPGVHFIFLASSCHSGALIDVIRNRIKDTDHKVSILTSADADTRGAGFFFSTMNFLVKRPEYRGEGISFTPEAMGLLSLNVIRRDIEAEVENYWSSVDNKTTEFSLDNKILIETVEYLMDEHVFKNETGSVLGHFFLQMFALSNDKEALLEYILNSKWVEQDDKFHAMKALADSCRELIDLNDKDVFDRLIEIAKGHNKESARLGALEILTDEQYEGMNKAVVLDQLFWSSSSENENNPIIRNMALGSILGMVEYFKDDKEKLVQLITMLKAIDDPELKGELEDEINSLLELQRSCEVESLITEAKGTSYLASARNFLSQARALAEDIADNDELKKRIAQAERIINAESKKLLLKRIKEEGVCDPVKTDLKELYPELSKDDASILYAVNYVANNIYGELGTPAMTTLVLGSSEKEFEDGLAYNASKIVSNMKDENLKQEALATLKLMWFELICNNSNLTFDSDHPVTVDLVEFFTSDFNEKGLASLLLSGYKSSDYLTKEIRALIPAKENRGLGVLRLEKILKAL